MQRPSAEQGDTDGHDHNHDSGDDSEGFHRQHPTRTGWRYLLTALSRP
jgi:hypothetical protein